MRRKTSGRITGVLATLAWVIAAFSTQAATYSLSTANVSGNWTNVATWDVVIGVPVDNVGVADRINLSRAVTTTVNTPVILGATDFIVHGVGTLQINTGGTVSASTYSKQANTGSSTLIMNGGTLNLTGTGAGGSRLGQDTLSTDGTRYTSYIQMNSGTVTLGSSTYASISAATMYTQSGGIFNSTAKDLTMANNVASTFDATISGGTFKVGNWSLTGGANNTLNMTINGSGQDLVTWGNLNGSAGNIVNLNFNLDSGWDAARGQVALGTLNLSADTATVNVDLGTYNATVGDIIVLASGTAYGESRTAAINTTGVAFNSLTDGVTFNNVSDTDGLKIQITSIPEPATIGMLGLGSLAVILLRRMSTR